MAIKNENGRFVIYFQWKKERLETVSEAKNLAEAKRIEKDVKSAFRVYRFDSLDEAAKSWVIRTHENKGWPLPAELARPLPGDEPTLIAGYQGSICKPTQTSLREKPVSH